MNKNSLTGNMDVRIVFLIDSSAYFGSHGVIHIFKKLYMKDMLANLAVGDSTLAMQYLNILYSAMTYSAKGNIFAKLRVFLILFTIVKWVKKVRYSAALGKFPLSAGECHILMSIAARRLQILQKLRLHHVFRDQVHLLTHEMYHYYKSIEKLTDTKGDEFKADASILLLAKGLLYELATEGVINLPEAPVIKETIWRYAMCYEFTKDRDTAQVVSRLFRAIGYNEEAMQVARRANNLDQIAKSA